jgi:hypothetical protein
MACHYNSGLGTMNLAILNVGNLSFVEADKCVLMVFVDCLGKVDLCSLCFVVHLMVVFLACQYRTNDNALHDLSLKVKKALLQQVEIYFLIATQRREATWLTVVDVTWLVFYPTMMSRLPIQWTMEYLPYKT